MSALGWIALLLGGACLAVLAQDLARARTAFAQFEARRGERPLVFWLGIAGWGACLIACALVASGDYLVQNTCVGEAPCRVMVRLPA